VVEEMSYWYERGYRQFNFDDDNFNMLRQRVFDICDGIERAGLTDVVLRCSNGIRADRCDRELRRIARQPQDPAHGKPFCDERHGQGSEP
jgi:hypothetical protein